MECLEELDLPEQLQQKKQQTQNSQNRTSGTNTTHGRRRTNQTNRIGGTNSEKLVKTTSDVCMPLTSREDLSICCFVAKIYGF